MNDGLVFFLSEEKNKNLFIYFFRALRKNPSARERPPLVTLQKTRKSGGGETYSVRDKQRRSYSDSQKVLKTGIRCFYVL